MEEPKEYTWCFACGKANPIMCFSDGSERRSKRGTITTGYAGEVKSFSYKYKKRKPPMLE